MNKKLLPNSVNFKLDLLFEGLRYSDALAEAAKTAFPNFTPYRFIPGELNPTGKKTVPIPYLMISEDDTHMRINGQGGSPWVVGHSPGTGYQLSCDRDNTQVCSVGFEPLPQWMQMSTEDGTLMAQSGVSLHGDMMVINVAPGCEYFLQKENSHALRCTFCSYGAPDERMRTLDQHQQAALLSASTLTCMQQTIRAALNETTIRHIYLVGGSMLDWQEEGRRFIQLAREVQAVVDYKIPVSCGSGALPPNVLDILYQEKLVDAVCFNLEIWGEKLFAKVCPGKHKYVGYAQWIESLEYAVSLWGRGRVYTAMVAGVELDPAISEYSWEEAAEIAIKGAEDLCSRSIIPIYSIYWGTREKDRSDFFQQLRAYFEALNLGYYQIRKKYQLKIWEGFMCHRCAYMQLECDIDRAFSAS